ncbi:HEAT repeat domain-containing protein [Candidatus Uabimicrobium sp. HlEnr_7]|uniref:HEAT repeat domain-containing protein n=1 Tax=Candidatus Uabimicrobium helgolandensis TaxID=3095367 RepID=UPI003555E4C0
MIFATFSLADESFCCFLMDSANEFPSEQLQKFKEVFIINLYSSSDRVKKSAAKALARMISSSPKNEKITQTLVDLLKEKEEIQGFVIWILAKAKIPFPVLSLIHFLKKDNLRVKALWYLGRMGKEASAAIPVIIPLLKDNNREVRIYAVWSLGEIGNKQATAEICKAYFRNDICIKRYAVQTIAKIAFIDKKVSAVLKNALSQNDRELKKQVAWAFLQFENPKRILPHLIKILRDSDPDVVFCAADVIQQISWKYLESHEPSLLYKEKNRIKRKLLSFIDSLSTKNESENEVAIKAFISEQVSTVEAYEAESLAKPVFFEPQLELLEPILIEKPIFGRDVYPAININFMPNEIAVCNYLRTVGIGEFISIEAEKLSENNQETQLNLYVKKVVKKRNFFTALLSENAGRPGPIERLIAQSNRLLRFFQMTIGLRFLKLINIFDVTLETFTNYIHNLFYSWQMYRSLRRTWQRDNSRLSDDLALAEFHLSRVFLVRDLLQFYKEESDTKKELPSFPLKLVIEARNHLDCMKRDLSILTLKQTFSTSKKSLVDFLLSFIPNPISILTPWKDFFIIVFMMKHSRGEILKIYQEMLYSYRELVNAFQQNSSNTDKLEERINHSQNLLQQVIQILANPNLFMYPKTWSRYDLIIEIQQQEKRGQVQLPLLIEFERWLTKEVKKALISKEVNFSSEECRQQLQEFKQWQTSNHCYQKLKINFM